MIDNTRLPKYRIQLCNYETMKKRGSIHLADDLETVLCGKDVSFPAGTYYTISSDHTGPSTCARCRSVLGKQFIEGKR